MIQNNKIKENKYKILRMSLLLGNGEDREETLNNFEDASRDIDAMNNEIYLKDLEKKFYETNSLEEEEKKLTSLVDYIGGRIEQRMSLQEDFSNITGYELNNLTPIKYSDRIDELKNRLYYIREYLENTSNIEKLNNEISDLENKLNNNYVNKAKSEERNNKSEEELLEKFINIIRKKEEYNDIDIQNVQAKLEDVSILVDDSKKSLDIFNKSFTTLNQAGISKEEEEEYASYVKTAKEDYYENKEKEYILKLYILLHSKETEYRKILAKRDSINEIIYNRISLRKELRITKEDILASIYNIIERQYDDISSQKEIIDNIEYLNEEITKRKDIVTSLEKDNQKVEILSLLKEYNMIDTYEFEEVNLEEDNLEEENIYNQDELESSEDKLEKSTEPVEIDTPEFEFDNDIEPKENEINIPNYQENNEDSKIELNIRGIDNNSSDFDIDTKESPEEDVVEEPKENETNDITTDNKKEIDFTNAEENQVMLVSDAPKLNIEEAIIKSNNVMRRVGEMLGVKVENQEETSNKEENISTPDNEPFENNIEINNENSSEEEQNDLKPETNKEEEIKIDENIFMNNFDADPENSMEINNTNEPPAQPQENPLFNNELANKTIDDIMTDNKLDDNTENNDFWVPAEDTPIDLNSLPDITSNTNDNNQNNIFFGNNNELPNLDFPSLDSPTDNKEAVQ